MKKAILPKINLCLKILIALTGVGLFIAHCVDGETWYKTGSYIATIILPFFPNIFRFFGLRITDRLQLAYQLFLVISMIMGIDFDLYRTWYIFGNPCFDKIAHALSGALAAFAAKEILDNCYQGTDVKVSGSSARVKHYDTRFTWTFIVSFVAFTAAGWECFEFLYDQLCGGHMQTLISAGVEDTMWDIIGALGVGIVFAFPLSKKS